MGSKKSSAYAFAPLLVIVPLILLIYTLFLLASRFD